MFQTPLQMIQSATNENGALKYTGPYDQFLTHHGYGKDAVKMMHLRRDGPVHTIRQLEVSTRIKLNSQKEYLGSDNSNIVSTTAHTNMPFLEAKMHGVENPEKFAIMLARKNLSQYANIAVVQIHIDEYPWQRISVETDDKTDGATVEHNHAFTYSPNSIRCCEVMLRRNDPNPTVISGIKGLRLIKTTQASFVNFQKDVYYFDEERLDRVFCVVCDASWEFTDHENVNFCEIFRKVKNIIIKGFAGDPKVGKMSPSSQRVLYLIEKEILEKIPPISKVSMAFQNKHYGDFDTKPFESIAPGNEKVVFIPTEDTHSTVYGQMSRKDLKTHL